MRDPGLLDGAPDAQAVLDGECERLLDHDVFARLRGADAQVGVRVVLGQHIHGVNGGIAKKACGICRCVVGAVGAAILVGFGCDHVAAGDDACPFHLCECLRVFNADSAAADDANANDLTHLFTSFGYRRRVTPVEARSSASLVSSPNYYENGTGRAMDCQAACRAKRA